MPISLDVNLGLPETPKGVPEELFSEFRRIYGAIKGLASYSSDAISTGTIPRVLNVPYAPVVSVSITGYDQVNIGVLTGPMTLSFTGGVDGQAVRIRFIQDAVGSRVVTLGAMFKVGSDIIPDISGTPNSRSYLGIDKYATGNTYDVVASVRGYS
jgi:hypothetical protein